MRNLILRNIIISVLLIVALLVIFSIRNRLPYGNRQSSFAVTHGNEITRIEISDSNNKLILLKEGDRWLVNGTGESRKSAVLFMLQIVSEMRIKSPVAPELFNSEIAVKGIVPVKVKVFKRNRLLKSFLVFKTGSNPYGNIMKTNRNSKPFIVYVPGNDADIGSVFITDELFWEPFSIFNLLPSEISSVTMEYYADTASSFTITSRDGIYRLSDLRDDLTGWDSSRVRRYVSYFTRIPFENWAFDLSPEEMKDIGAGVPLCRITVRQTDGNEVTLLMWNRYDNETGARDSDRLYGRLSNHDKFIIIRYFDIDPILKKRSYFYLK